MTDHIDPDKVRELAKLHRKWAEEDSGIPGMKDTHTHISEVLESLLTPTLPTLADLIEEGHDPAQYQWGQAEHRDERCIIVRINVQPPHIDVSLLTATGSTIWVSPDEVIPRPDKPRLVWPAEFHPEPGKEAPNDSAEPKVGEAWLVSTREGGQREALKAGNRWYVKDGDDVQDWVEEALIPIARLVPEPAEETPDPMVAPEVLVTGEDYGNAPYGTICAEDGHFPLYTSTWTWYTIGGDSHDHRDLAGTPRRVLRWGMGEEA